MRSFESLSGQVQNALHTVLSYEGSVRRAGPGARFTLNYFRKKERKKEWKKERKRKKERQRKTKKDKAKERERKWTRDSPSPTLLSDYLLGPASRSPSDEPLVACHVFQPYTRMGCCLPIVRRFILPRLRTGGRDCLPHSLFSLLGLLGLSVLCDVVLKTKARKACASAESCFPQLYGREGEFWVKWGRFVGLTF